MYKAKIEIGEYKVGEEVPTDKAKIWEKMYVESPVEEVVIKPITKKESPVERKPIIKSRSQRRK